MARGRYDLGKLLGQGGMGEVFIARDTTLGRDVALKLLHAEHTRSEDLLRRFLQEARAAARITHAGIVTVFDCGVFDDGVAYIAMELLAGESLGTRARRMKKLPEAMVIDIGKQIASALDAAHKAGIIHRDLKPDNVFLVEDPALPSGERVKVLDFGIAKLAPDQKGTDGIRTSANMVFGTPRYMSPEQCKSATTIDARSDIYSLGCILFELATGTQVFDGEALVMIGQHQLQPPPRVRDRAPEVSAQLGDAIYRMLAKDPEARPASMREVRQLLGAPLDTPAVGTRVPAELVANTDAVTTMSGASGAVARQDDPPKKRGWMVAVGAVALLAIGGVVFAMTAGPGKGGETVHESAAPKHEPAPPSEEPPVPPPTRAGSDAPPPVHVEAPAPPKPVDPPLKHDSPKPLVHETPKHLDPPKQVDPPKQTVDPPKQVDPPPQVDPPKPPCTPVKDNVVDPFVQNPCK